MARKVFDIRPALLGGRLHVSQARCVVWIVRSPRRLWTTVNNAGLFPRPTSEPLHHTLSLLMELGLCVNWGSV